MLRSPHQGDRLAIETDSNTEPYVGIGTPGMVVDLVSNAILDMMRQTGPNMLLPVSTGGVQDEVMTCWTGCTTTLHSLLHDKSDKWQLASSKWQVAVAVLATAADYGSSFPEIRGW